ncbi:MAG: helix-turn-helix domain-containing protein [Hyphomicrobiales bacterium]|nr:helix-turn-helix domain-containing protein [Hyphomicrobiales bacterium]
MSVFTPRQVADRWQCSERHVRNLIRVGTLRSFRIGGKLLRIAEDAVREVECQATPSDDSMASSSSLSGETESGNVTALAPATRAKLNVARHQFSKS